MKLSINYTYLFAAIFFSTSVFSNDHQIPNLVGTWVGVNNTLSEQRGYRSWEKKVEILSKKIEGSKEPFSYTDGTKNFFGVIHPDNETITWVASNSRGYNIGKLLDKNNISACYIEAGIDATAGCADLKRK